MELEDLIDFEVNLGKIYFFLDESQIKRLQITEKTTVQRLDSKHNYVSTEAYKGVIVTENDSQTDVIKRPKRGQIFETKYAAACSWIIKQKLTPREVIQGVFENKLDEENHDGIHKT